jgi:hypothetical protein
MRNLVIELPDGYVAVGLYAPHPCGGSFMVDGWAVGPAGRIPGRWGPEQVLPTGRGERLAVNPRRSIRRAERGIVRGLAAEGLTDQHQVTHGDRFEIAVEDLRIRVEVVAQ